MVPQQNDGKNLLPKRQTGFPLDLFGSIGIETKQIEFENKTQDELIQIRTNKYPISLQFLSSSHFKSSKWKHLVKEDR